MTKLSGMPRLSVIGCHLVRAGQGLDALQLHARGYGVLFGASGLHLVWGEFHRVLLRRFNPRVRVFFLGVHGLTWATIRLADAVPLNVPSPIAPRLPTVRAALVPRVPTEAVPVGRASVPMYVIAPPVPDVDDAATLASSKEPA